MEEVLNLYKAKTASILMVTDRYIQNPSFGGVWLLGQLGLASPARASCQKQSKKLVGVDREEH